MADYNDFLKSMGLASQNDEKPLMVQENLIPQPTAPVSQPEVTNQQQTAAGLLNQFAVPRDANYQAPKIQVPQEDPQVAKAQADILVKLGNLDKEYKKNLEDAERRKFNSEIFAAIGNYLPGVVAGATAMRTKAAVKPIDLPKITARDTTGEVNSKYKTDYENLLNQYKTVKDGAGLSAKDKLYAEIAQAQLEQGAERINANKENTDRNAGIRVGAAVLKDQKDNELTDKQVEAQTDLDNTLSEIKKITKDAEKFKDMLGPNVAKYEELKEGRLGAIVPGKINKEFVKFRSDAKALKGQYQKIISGLTLSDQERAELNSYIPNVEMPYETFKASAEAFERRVNELRKKTKGNQAKYQGKNTEGYNQPTTNAAPYGDTVERNGKTYKWNATAGKYQPIN